MWIFGEKYVKKSNFRIFLGITVHSTQQKINPKIGD